MQRMPAELDFNVDNVFVEFIEAFNHVLPLNAGNACIILSFFEKGPEYIGVSASMPPWKLRRARYPNRTTSPHRY